jgi:hypothetical protein
MNLFFMGFLFVGMYVGLMGARRKQPACTGMNTGGLAFIPSRGKNIYLGHTMHAMR